MSSVVSTDTVSLYRASLALHWLPARHIAARWLPAHNIALIWLSQLGSSSQGLQTGCRIATPYPGSLHWLPVLHIALYWLPTVAPTTRFFISRSKVEL